MTFRIAWRSLWRNRTRTAISLSAISLSLTLMLIGFGVNDDGYAQMLAAAEKAAGGSVLVHGDGWWLERRLDQVVPSPGPVLEAARAAAGVRVAAPRVVATALISSPRGNAGVELRGIEPESEARIQDVARFVKEGTFLAGGSAARRPLVLGKGIARDLGLALGDRAVLTATDPRGEMTRALFHVTGIIESQSKLLDDAAAFTTVRAAQEALGLGEAVTQIGLGLEPRTSPAEVQAALRAALAGAPGLEVLTWQEAMPEMLRIVEADKRTNWIFALVILTVVGFGIANTFLMSVMERVRELGLLGALGVTPGGIARLILSETVVLAAVATTLGLALSLSLHAWLSVAGFDMRSITENGSFEMSGVLIEDYRIRSTIIPARWIASTSAVICAVFASSLYPALRAARLAPVEAMRTCR